MKKAVDMEIKGLKCDNPKCDYSDMSIKMEDYENWIDSKCPKCGEILLTEVDYNNVKILQRITSLTNNIFGEIEDDSEVTKMTVNMNGTGEMILEIENNSQSK